MLELSALGLLQQEPLHGYRLKQRLELFMGSCISVNYGAIYPLLRRLEEQGYIKVLLEEAGDAGSNRKIYGITPAGCDRWRQKMLEHPRESWVKSRARFLIKFFFFSNLQPQERIQLIEHRLKACYQRQTYFNQQNWAILGEDPYQAIVWQRAQQNLESEIKWLDQTWKSLTADNSVISLEKDVES